MYIFFECVLFTIELDFQAVQFIQAFALAAICFIIGRFKK